MTEQELNIEIGDNLEVEGLLRGELTNTVTIFVHGLTGSSLVEHQFYNGARYLEQHGIPNYRYELYSSRPLIEATLRTHAADLDAVVRYFRNNGVSTVYVIGHSYGGPTTLLSEDRDFDSVVLWDPSYRPTKKSRKSEPIDHERLILNWNPDVVVGRKMIEEEKTIEWDALGKNITVPLKVIAAGDGVLYQHVKIYADNAAGKSEFVIIDGADHIFCKNDTAEQLFAETLSWLKAK